MRSWKKNWTWAQNKYNFAAVYRIPFNEYETIFKITKEEKNYFVQSFEQSALNSNSIYTSLQFAFFSAMPPDKVWNCVFADFE